MSEAAALKPPSTAKEAMAAILAAGIVLGAAQLASLGLKGLVEDGVRSSVTGMVFASVPAVYGFSNRAMNGFKSPRLETPELYPWYVTGLLTGFLIFAWTQFVNTFAVIAVAQYASATGAEFQPGQAALATVFITLPMLLPASIWAGLVLNRMTRGLVVLALVLAAVLPGALNIWLSYLLASDLIAEMTGGQLSPQVLFGMAIPSIVVFIFAGIGILFSKLRRERSLGRLTNAARRLKPEERDQALDEIVRTLAAKAPE